jgi:hypothetical protein
MVVKVHIVAETCVKGFIQRKYHLVKAICW